MNVDEYAKLLKLGNPFTKHVKAIETHYKSYFDNPIEDVFISQTTTTDSVDQYLHMTFFSADCIVSYQNFISSQSQESVVIPTRDMRNAHIVSQIQEIRGKKTPLLRIVVRTSSTGLEFLALGDGNCQQLRAIWKRFIAPHLGQRPNQ